MVDDLHLVHQRVGIAMLHRVAVGGIAGVRKPRVQRLREIGGDIAQQGIDNGVLVEHLLAGVRHPNSVADGVARFGKVGVWILGDLNVGPEHVDTQRLRNSCTFGATRDVDQGPVCLDHSCYRLNYMNATVNGFVNGYDVGFRRIGCLGRWDRREVLGRVQSNRGAVGQRECYIDSHVVASNFAS
ncbi:hypothetical protein ES703_92243 [subsurface metagenome]